jgi:hypothetical protein
VIGFSVLGLLLALLAAGWLVGQWVAIDEPGDFVYTRRDGLQLSFSQGYLDGAHLGRQLAERATSPMSGEEMARVVAGGLDGVEAQLSARGPEYARGFNEGAHVGLRQRMRERFGPPVARIGARNADGRQPAVRAPAVQARRVEAQVTEVGGGIHAVILPDGTVEYTNLRM